MTPKRRPKPWAETGRQGRTRYVWRFGGQKYRTAFYDDAEEARADGTAQVTQQIQGTWRDRSGPRTLLEDWIDAWTGMLDDIEPTTRSYYRYLVEFHILAEFQGRELGSLTFEEIEAWDRSIPKRINTQGRPYARSVASAARSLLITIVGDAVHAGKLDRNPAERRKGRRGAKRAKGRAPARAAQPATSNVITPLQALCLAERCALLSGHEPEHAGTKGIENQANRFAAAFLMPADDIRSVLPPAPAWNELLILKSRWCVSIGALLMRARTLRVMPEPTYVQAIRYMSTRGWRTSEPGDLGAGEAPQLLALAAAAARQSGVHISTLSAETGWPEPIISDLLAASSDPRPKSGSDFKTRASARPARLRP